MKVWEMIQVNDMPATHHNHHWFWFNFFFYIKLRLISLTVTRMMFFSNFALFTCIFLLWIQPLSQWESQLNKKEQKLLHLYHIAESQEGSVKAALVMVDFGSRWARRRVGLILGLMIPDLARVHIGLTFGGLSNEESVLREARLVFGCWSVLRFLTIWVGFGF